MFKVLFKLVVMHPQLLLTHAQNYADLVREEVQHTFITWRLRLFMFALSAAFLGLGVLSSAMALLLWAALPLLNPAHAWILVALPAAFFLISAFLYVLLKRQKNKPLLGDIQEQLKLDLLHICQAGRS